MCTSQHFWGEQQIALHRPDPDRSVAGRPARGSVWHWLSAEGQQCSILKKRASLRCSKIQFLLSINALRELRAFFLLEVKFQPRRQAPRLR